MNQSCAITHSPIFKNEEIVVLIPQCLYKKTWDREYLYRTDVYFGHYDGDGGMIEDSTIKNWRRAGEMGPVFILHCVWDAITRCILPETLLDGKTFKDSFNVDQKAIENLWSPLGPGLRCELTKVVLFCRAMKIYLFNGIEFEPGQALSMKLWVLYITLVCSQSCRINYQYDRLEEDDESA